MEALHEGIDFSLSLTRAKFEELNQDLFKKTLDVSCYGIFFDTVFIEHHSPGIKDVYTALADLLFRVISSTWYVGKHRIYIPGI